MFNNYDRWKLQTPEEYHESMTGEKEFAVKFTMSGEIIVFAKDEEEAIDKAKEISNFDLLDFVDDVEFE